MNFEKLSEQEILAIATPIMDNLMDASTRIDHAAHVRDFTDRLKRLETKDYFEKVCHQYQTEKGFFAARTLLAVLRRSESAVIIWKQHFTKAEGEFVAEMVLMDQNGVYCCDHAMVF